MASEVQICNMALIKIGSTRNIDSLDEQTREARYCKQLFEPVRDAVLREWDWNFATALAELTPVDTPAFGYSYAYELPNGCLKARRLSIPAAVFRIVGSQLHTNQETAALEYTKRIADPNLFDVSFVMALAARMAAELAEPVAKSSTKNQTMWTEYLNALQAARTADSSEGLPDPVQTDSWITAMGVGETQATIFNMEDS